LSIEDLKYNIQYILKLFNMKEVIVTIIATICMELMKKIFLLLGIVLFLSSNSFAQPAASNIVDYANSMYSLAKQKKPQPEYVQGVKMVSAKEANKLYKEGAIFLDARVKSYYNLVKIPNAKWFFDQDLLDNDTKLASLDKNKAYVTYCLNEICPRSGVLAVIMKQNDFNNVYWLRNGILEWDKEGYPLDRKVGVTGIPASITIK